MLNSRYPLACAPCKDLRRYRASFFRRYGGNLPSSFRILLSSALVYSTFLPVSVLVRSILCGYFQEPLHCIFNPIRKYNLRDPSTHRRYRNINLFPISFAFRLHLRGRLTPPGLSLDGKPWVFGEEDFHLLYRYSCQHSHFQSLQQTLPVYLHCN